MGSLRRKLFALSYAKWDSFNYADDAHWRDLVVWLENQKLRVYKVEDRTALYDVNSANWQKTFDKYLEELDCDLDSAARANRLHLCDWLLCKAVHFEFSDNYEALKQGMSSAMDVTESNVSQTTVTEVTKMDAATTKPKQALSNPFDHLDFDSDEFRQRTRKLCELLNIPPYGDAREELKAACTLIANRLNEDNLKRFDAEHGRSKINILPLEFVQATLAEATRPSESTGQDSITDTVSRILRVLHVRELRALQSAINETVIELQKITANPKTDESLGKVGF